MSNRLNRSFAGIAYDGEVPRRRIWDDGCMLLSPARMELNNWVDVKMMIMGIFSCITIYTATQHVLLEKETFSAQRYKTAKHHILEFCRCQKMHLKQCDITRLSFLTDQTAHPWPCETSAPRQGWVSMHLGSHPGLNILMRNWDSRCHLQIKISEESQYPLFACLSSSAAAGWKSDALEQDGDE